MEKVTNKSGPNIHNPKKEVQIKLIICLLFYSGYSSFCRSCKDIQFIPLDVTFQYNLQIETDRW